MANVTIGPEMTTEQARQQQRRSKGNRDEETPLLGERVEERYSTFSSRQKRYIIFTAAFASTFSPLSSNIYYPAINSIADDLSVTVSLVNLTITAYMVFQGLAPTFMGNLSDTAGRRPVYILCFGIYICANVGVALQKSYLGLLILRCAQSAGSSGTVALANAVAADTVTSAERGMYLGLASLGSILGPAVGPILGGCLSQYLGWRSIFWFLAVFASVFFVPFLLFYPETCRAVVGDGSIPPPAWNKSLLNYFRDSGNSRTPTPIEPHPTGSSARKRRVKFPNPLTTLKLLFDLPTAPVLLCNGIGYAAHFAVTSSIPSQFKKIYQLNDFQIGLAFLPISLGTICSAFSNGYLVDWNFRRLAARHGAPRTRGKKQDLSNFPIEKARLQVALPMLYGAATSVAAYGWLLDARLPIAVPLAHLFAVGFAITASYNVFNVLIVDLNYSHPATATAANNLVRCLLGAGATAVVVPLLDHLGRGWTFSVVAAVWVAASPLAFAVYRWGFGWRREGDARRAEDEW